MPAAITEYKKGKIHGSLKQFDKRGRIISEIEYKNGLRDGMYYLYDKRGKVLAEKKFSKGVQVIEGGKNGTSFNPR